MVKSTRSDFQRGFTLPELLVAAVFLLACVGGMLLLIRPANYDIAHRNAERRIDLAALMTAIANYRAAEGKLPPTITTKETFIATSEDGGPSLCDDLVPKYMDDLPYDSTASFKAVEDGSCAHPEQFYVTGYKVRVDQAGRVVLTADTTEGNETILVERWFPFL